MAENLKLQQHIDTDSGPSYSENAAGVQDEKEIVAWLERKRRSRHRNRYINSERFDFDARSLSCIGMIRNNSHPQKIEHARAILVTQDPYLNKCMRTLCPDTFPREIDFTILDMDLASLLWLNNYNPQSSLPFDLLVANASALNLASAEIMDRAFELTDELEKSGDLTPAAALTIRSQPKMKKYLAETTQNNPSALTHTTLHETLEKYISSENEKITQKLTAQHEQEMARVRKEVQALKEERSRRLAHFTEIANRDASRISHICGMLATILSVSILLFSVCVWFLKLGVDYFGQGLPAWKYIFIFLDTLSLLQIIDYLWSPHSITRKWCSKVKDWVFMHVYSYLVDKFERY